MKLIVRNVKNKRIVDTNRPQPSLTYIYIYIYFFFLGGRSFFLIKKQIYIDFCGEGQIKPFVDALVRT